MRAKVIVVTPFEGSFRLITDKGYPIGGRLLTVAPEKDREYPDLQDTFEKKLDADRAALRWNQYLLHASKKRAKRKNVGTEE